VNRRRLSGGSFVKQAAILAGASIFVRLLGFFYRIPLTRYIGDTLNAYYGAAYFVYTLALTLSSVFMITAVSRLTSERVALGQYRNAQRLFGTAMLLSVVLGSAVSLIMFFGADFIERIYNFESGTLVSAIRVLAPAVFLVSMLTVLRGYFQGMKTAAPTAVSQVIEQIFNVIASLFLAFLLFGGENFSAAAAGAAAGTSVGAFFALLVMLFVYMLVAKALKRRSAEDSTEYIEPRRKQAAAILKMAFPLIIGAAIFTIASMMDVSMANNRLAASGAFSGEEITALVGQFTGKFVLLTTLPVSLSMALSSAIIPEITSSHVTLDKEAVRQKTNLALRISMFLAIPSAVGLGVLADPIILLLFSRHPEGGALLRYGAASIVFLSIVHVITGVLQGLGHVKIPIIGVFFGVMVKIPINYYLMAIPEINVLGGVISTVVCFIVAAIINLFFLKHFTDIFPAIVGTFVKPTIAAAGMGIVCYTAYNLIMLVGSNAAATLGAISLGFVAYLVFMLLMKGFGRREIELLPIPRGVKRWLV